MVRIIDDEYYRTLPGLYILTGGNILAGLLQLGLGFYFNIHTMLLISIGVCTAIYLLILISVVLKLRLLLGLWVILCAIFALICAIIILLAVYQLIVQFRTGEALAEVMFFSITFLSFCVLIFLITKFIKEIPI